jgi:ABC-type uncharacterized transport system permease subunit
MPPLMMSVLDELIQRNPPSFLILLFILVVILAILRDELNRDGPTRRECAIMIFVILMALIPVIVSLVLWGDEIPETWQPFVTGLALFLMASVYLSFLITAFGTKKKVETTAVQLEGEEQAIESIDSEGKVFGIVFTRADKVCFTLIAVVFFIPYVLLYIEPYIFSLGLLIGLAIIAFAVIANYLRKRRK